MPDSAIMYEKSAGLIVCVVLLTACEYNDGLNPVTIPSLPLILTQSPWLIEALALSL
jgi:hypothetical protein